MIDCSIRVSQTECRVPLLINAAKYNLNCLNTLDWFLETLESSEATSELYYLHVKDQ